MNKKLLLITLAGFSVSGSLHADIITHFFESFFSSSQATPSEYPASTAPINVITEKDKDKKYSEVFAYDTYHHVQATYPFKEGGRVVLDSDNGSIIVEASDVNDAIAVDILLEPQVLKAPIKTTLEVDPSRGIAEIQTSLLKSNARISAKMKVTVPRKTEVIVKTKNGKVVLDGTVGLADLQSTNGLIAVRNHIGATKVLTSNGVIEADTLSGAIDLKTLNGNIEAKNLQAENALHIETKNGAIETNVAEIKDVKQAKISATNGAIELTVPKSLQGTVIGETVNGTVKGDLWQKSDSNTSAKKEVTIGNGSLHLSLRTINANIYAEFGK